MEEYYEKDLGDKKIKKKIIIEYVIFLFAIVIPILFNKFILNSNDNENVDYIGQALALVIIARLFKYFITFITCFIYPIIVLKFYKKSGLKESLTKNKKIIYNFLIILPILYTFFIILSIPIQNLIYDFKYNKSFGEYRVKESDYKLPIDFYNELKKRNLLYSEDTYNIMNKLNGEHNCINYIHDNRNIIPQKCYEKSTMMGITDEIYYDSIKKSNITNMYKNSFPVYVYNAILTLPSRNEKMQYAALGRFAYNTDDYGEYSAYFNDYYIECKILYVDGDIYAIIGIGQSYSIEKHFGFGGNASYMILSEKPTITTYANGRYHTKGSIVNNLHGFEMHANNKNSSHFFSKYPVKQVKKLNKNTIDKVANELQNSILKESIEEHYDNKN